MQSFHRNLLRTHNTTNSVPGTSVSAEDDDASAEDLTGDGGLAPGTICPGWEVVVAAAAFRFAVSASAFAFAWAATAASASALAFAAAATFAVSSRARLWH